MENLELRYIQSGIVYLPQFKQPQFSDEWKYFTRDTFEPNCILGILASRIASINNHPNFSYPVYHLPKKLFYRVYFKEEYQVMAFLGGAKSYYTQREVNFEL